MGRALADDGDCKREYLVNLRKGVAQPLRRLRWDAEMGRALADDGDCKREYLVNLRKGE